MRHWIAPAVIALAGSAPASAAPAEAPQLNNCHGGQCSWSLTRSRALVRQEAVGSLYRLSLLSGSGREGSSRIRWNRRPHEVFVFCSALVPAVILPEQGRFQIDVLDFVAGPTRYLEGSASLYGRTCHPGEDWAAAGFAARHGYRAQHPGQQIVLSQLEDIFYVH